MKSELLGGNCLAPIAANVMPLTVSHGNNSGSSADHCPSRVAAPKGTWLSVLSAAYGLPLCGIQNALKPALRAVECEFVPTSRNQEFEVSKVRVLKTSKAPYTEVSERDFSRPDSKEATKPETKGAGA